MTWSPFSRLRCKSSHGIDRHIDQSTNTKRTHRFRHKTVGALSIVLEPLNVGGIDDLTSPITGIGTGCAGMPRKGCVIRTYTVHIHQIAFHANMVAGTDDFELPSDIIIRRNDMIVGKTHPHAGLTAE